jgi:alkylated DNA repair dioxygenase AlkB
MPRHANQPKLIDTPQRLPNGLVYRPDFITLDEEETILHYLENMPLYHGEYTIRSIGETITTKRRYAGFGWKDGRLPRWLTPLQGKVAKWLDVPRESLGNALINEYLPGMGMGFHRDEGNIQHVIGISLGGWAVMRFRPYGWDNPANIISPKRSASQSVGRNPEGIFSLEVERRSVYIMQKEVHYQWQHSVMPVKVKRYSITFRTGRGASEL